MFRNPLQLSLIICFIGICFPLHAWQLNPAPDRRDDEGQGPFQSLVIKGCIVIDGTGAPPRGPINILVTGNRIAKIFSGPVPDDVEQVLDATGMYLLPGFVDMHAHAGDAKKAPDAEYCYKLWLGHGVTTVRGVPLSGDNEWVISEQQRSFQNQIVAPRIINYQRPPSDLRTAEEATRWVAEAPGRGIEGLKLNAYRPEIMKALLVEAKRLRMGSVAHLAQTGVANMDAMDAARLGLGTVTHFYGHFEALLKDHTVQPFPADYNYNNEQDRFGQVARLWDKIHPPGSPEWKAYLQEHLELGTVFDPTLTIYSAGRDLMRARTADWHDEYTLPSLMAFFEPSRVNHGSFWFNWTTADEIEWKNFYRVWMQLVNDYKKMGGRVTTGADSGFIYDTYGFGYIEELELLQEAGFHPLEVIQAATMNGAETIFEPKRAPIQFGVIREGLLADMILVEENPLANFKVLFGNGTIRLDEKSGEVKRVGGVRWTIKDGIIYDAIQLREDVKKMVAAQRKSGNADTEKEATEKEPPGKQSSEKQSSEKQSPEKESPENESGKEAEKTDEEETGNNSQQ